MKAFKKQHSSLKRNDMKTILGGILPNQCVPRFCRELCKEQGFERGGCDSNGLCLCGPFPNPNDL